MQRFEWTGLEDGTDRERIEALFVEVLELDQGEQASFLEQLSKDDPKVHQKLSELLQDFLGFNTLLRDGKIDEAIQQVHGNGERQATISIPHHNQGLTETQTGVNWTENSGQVPSKIGQYEILSETGRGGMARVYKARQQTPDREVAIKLLPGLGAPGDFLSRFHNEYQALALLGHTNIAVVYEAGQTPQGDAWIAMEYVDGLPITKYCQQQKLTFNERIQLFLQVLNGILHAHQQAVVHRDLKPNNILVAERSDGPLAKIIDFGLAKGLNQPLAESALETNHGSILGTPAYLCPEKMVFGVQRPVDIRGDIYALGVILYELLASRHPFDLKALEGLPLDEVFRVFREEEPLPPSRHSRGSGAKGGGFPPDLDNIVMKAMAKNIQQRYVSVAAFKEDLVRYLRNEPVSATRPGPAYLLKKFVLRNKALVGAAFLVFLTLLIGFFLSEKGRREAEIALGQLRDVNQFLENMLAAPNPKQGNREIRVADVLDTAVKELRSSLTNNFVSRIELNTTIGNSYFNLGLHQRALPLLREALALSRKLRSKDPLRTARAHFYLARVLRRLGVLNEAVAHFEKAIGIQKRRLGPEHQLTLRSQAGLAMTLYLQNKAWEAEILFRQTWLIQERVIGAEHPETLVSLVGLWRCSLEKKPEKAKVYLGKALQAQNRILGPDHPQSLSTSYTLGLCFLELNQYTEAEQLFRQTLMRRRVVLGEENPQTLSSCYGLAQALRYQGRIEEAMDLLVSLISGWRQEDYSPSMVVLRAWNLLATLFHDRGWRLDAIRLLNEFVQNFNSVGGSFDRQILKAKQNLGDFALKEQRFDLALSILSQSLVFHSVNDQDAHSGTVSLLATLGQTYEGMRLWDDAEFYYCRAHEISKVYFPRKQLTEDCAKLYNTFLARRAFENY